jgi:hypothetical protein
MAAITAEQLEDAARDAVDLGKIVNEAADFDGDGQVATRYGGDVPTVQKVLSQIPDTGFIGRTSYLLLSAENTFSPETLAITPASDAGTHIDPVVGGVVPNAGIFRYSSAPAGWRWLMSTSALVLAVADAQAQVLLAQAWAESVTPPAGGITASSKTWAGVSLSYVAQSQAYSITSSGYATSAAASEAAAAAAAGITLPAQPTKAAMDAAIGTYANGNRILVNADETQFGEASIYTKTAGVAVYTSRAGLSQQVDHLGRGREPARLGGERSIGLHLPKLIDDIRTGNRTVVRMMPLGDSMSDYSHPGGVEQVTRILSGHMKDSPVYALTTASTALTGAADTGKAFAGNYTSTSLFKDATFGYPRAWGGTMMKFTGVGQYCCYSGNSAGGGMFCNRIRYFFPCEPGGPTFKLQFSDNAGSGLCPLAGDADWEDPLVGQIATGPALTGSELLVSTDAPIGTICVELVMASFKQWHAKVIQTTAGTAAGYSLEPMFEIGEGIGKSAINSYRLCPSSNTPTAESATAHLRMVALIANWKPDILFVNYDDVLAGYQTFLPMVENAITAAGLAYRPIVFVEGAGYNSPDEAGLKTKIDWIRSFCGTRLGWYMPDLLSVIGGNAEATREGLIGDGTHANATAWRIAYNKIFGDLGLLPVDITGAASGLDTLKRISGRTVHTDVLDMTLLGGWCDTSQMTWSKSLAAGVAAAAAVTQGASGLIRIRTDVAANNLVIGVVNDGLHTMNVGRAAAYNGGVSFGIRPDTANVTGKLYATWASDRVYNGVYHGDLTGTGVGCVVENNLFYGICWVAGAQYKMPVGVALTAGMLNNVVIRLKDGFVYWYLNGTLVGSSAYLTSGTFLTFRFEATNGATAAEFSYYVTGPTLVSDQP